MLIARRQSLAEYEVDGMRPAAAVFAKSAEEQYVLVPLAAGNWSQTNDQIDFGGHTRRFAYYVSLNGNRSDYGLQPPIGQVVHDADNGYGGFAVLICNASPANQFRLDASLRQDYYQIPIDPDPNSAGNQVYPSYGLHDSEREPDGYLTFSWVHTFNANLLLTVSPFSIILTRPATAPLRTTCPVISTVNQTANYVGALQAGCNHPQE